MEPMEPIDRQQNESSSPQSGYATIVMHPANHTPCWAFNKLQKLIWIDMNNSRSNLDSYMNDQKDFIGTSVVLVS
jgi:hypothetical protein